MPCLIQDCPQPVNTVARCYYHAKEAAGLFDDHDRTQYSPESGDGRWESAPRLQEEYVKYEVGELTRLSTYVDLMEAEWTIGKGTL